MGTGVIVLTQMTGGGSSRYHEALFLPIFGMALFVPWPAFVAGLSFSSTVLVYDAVLIYFGTEGPLGTWLTNNFVLWAGVIIATIGVVLLRRVRRNEFEGRHRLSTALEQIRGLDRLKTQFFANISHELRMPLTLSIGPVQSLLERGRGERWEEQLGMVRRNLQRLLCLMNDLLDFSKIEAGKLRSVFVRTNVAERVAFLVSTADAATEVRGIKLRSQFPNEPLWAYIDRDKSDKIFMNLLSNAFKFTPSGGNIFVQLGTENESLKLSLQDTGIGIPQDKQDTIFDRFSQVDASTTRRYAGTGIGLAMVKEYAALHGGQVRCKSVEGEGSEFIVTIPLGRSHLDTAAIAERTVVQDEAPRIPMTEDIEEEEPEQPAWGEGRSGSQAYEDISVEGTRRLEAVMNELDDTPQVLVVDDSRDMRVNLWSLS